MMTMMLTILRPGRYEYVNNIYMYVHGWMGGFVVVVLCGWVGGRERERERENNNI